MQKEIYKPRLIAWELTRSCNLACRHCRASSERGPYPGELTLEECYKVLDDIASFAKPIMILTGGEPLLREDIFEIASYSSAKGLVTVMAPNGTLLTRETVRKIKASGVSGISVSLDGPDASSHDSLRQVPGAFKRALEGLGIAKEEGLSFQINSTITKRNVAKIEEITRLALKLGAKKHDIFLLVPTGRGKEMENEELAPEEYEEVLKLLCKLKKTYPIEIKVTCAPHFNRVLLQTHSNDTPLKGKACMAGESFCFISHVGELQPCGYLEIKCGNVREKDFKDIWLESGVFKNIRDWTKYKGKCGVCEFKNVCGGCRARAYAKYGDYLQEEPYCAYVPKIEYAG